MAVKKNKTNCMDIKAAVHRLMLQEKSQRLEKEVKTRRAKHREVKPTIQALEEAKVELAAYPANMDVDDPEAEENADPDDEEIQILKEQRRQLDDHEAELMKKRIGRTPPRKEEEPLFVDHDSGYESETLRPVTAANDSYSTIPIDGKDLCYINCDRAYYIISEQGPDKSIYRKYSARKVRLADILNDEDNQLKRLTKLRPEGTFTLTAVHGVVLPPGHGIKILLEKNWLIRTRKDGTKELEFPWI